MNQRTSIGGDTRHHRDLESYGTHFKLKIQQLQSIFDPKSIKNLLSLGGIQSLVSDLDTDIRNGLNRDHPDADTRKHIYGVNKLPAKNQKSFLQLCWEALHDQVLIILSISAIVSLALGLYQTFGQPPEYDDNGKPLPRVEWVDGCAILLAVIIVVCVGALNDYNKEKQFMKLNNKKEDRKVIVYRSNEKMYISVYDLLVGDLLYVETGDVIPADVILVHGECACDESSITGESSTIEKRTIDIALEYYNDEIKSINSSSHSNFTPVSSNSSMQFDVGDDGVPDPFLISGSQLLSGQGRALVVCVGENSINGKIMMSLQDNDDDEEDVTPLQARLDNLANGISKYGFMVAIVLFIILLVKFIYQLSTGKVNLSTAAKLSRFIKMIITSITIVVVAIPEGLPLAVTLALAFATTRMTEDGNLVRVLRSCETMGGATTVCSDKTGTLTINKMTVVQGFFGDDSIFNDLPNIENVTATANATELLQKCSNKLKLYLINNILLNSTAFENYDANQSNEDDSLINHGTPKGGVWDWMKNKLGIKSHGRYNHLLPPSAEQQQQDETNDTDANNLSPDEFVGSKTECALLTFVKHKFPTQGIVDNLHQFRDSNEKNTVKVIPFESSLKWSGIVLRDEDNGECTLYIKGAAEIVFDACDSLTRLNGDIMRIDETTREEIDAIRTEMASNALRAVSLAHYTFTDLELKNIDWETITPHELAEYPLTLDMMVGIQDPLRPGVRHAIEECHRAGVDVRMVTGDNVLTAKAISRGCGILTDETFEDDRYFMEGPQFRALNERERLQRVKTLHVLARSSPEDKRILVATLKKLGEVVAVTGDGTNDAPALKLADVGFSMGVSGTEVAREASDIVLMTDDFASIVNAIKWGRTVAASIRKFVQFQLTVNFTAVILTFITAILSKENASVLTAVQLLWVNLIMDTLAALALATDKPDEDVLDSKPEGRNSIMISANMWKMILGMSTFQLIITFTLNIYGCHLFFGKSESDLNTMEKMMIEAMTFNTFVWMQVFAMFVSRILNEPSNINAESSLMDRLCPQNVGFFRHITRNYWFINITLMISILQVLIMFYGGPAFSVVKQTPAMWIAALVSGYSMIPLGIVLRVIPDETLQRVLPLNAMLKCIGALEWLMFGCGVFQPREDLEECFNGGEEVVTENETETEAEDAQTRGNRTLLPSNRDINYDSVPEIFTSGSPSPILDPQQGSHGEHHKMNKLHAVLTSNNSSSSSFKGASHATRGSYNRERDINGDALFDHLTPESATETEHSVLK